MTCEETREILAPDPDERPATTPEYVAAWKHYRSCADCQRVFAFQRKIRAQVRGLGQAVRAPSYLRRRIVTALDAESPAPPARERSPARDFVAVPRRKRWGWAGVGMLAAAAAALFFVVRGPDGTRLTPQLVQVARSVSAGDSTMASREASQVRAWLESRVGYAIEVPAIARATLTGGRVIRVGAVATAAVTYRIDGQELVYFALPGDLAGPEISPDDVVTTSADGYHVAIWSESGAPRAVVAQLTSDHVRAIAEECRRVAAARQAL